MCLLSIFPAWQCSPHDFGMSFVEAVGVNLGYLALIVWLVGLKTPSSRNPAYACSSTVSAQVSSDRHTTLSTVDQEPSEGGRVGETLKAFRC